MLTIRQSAKCSIAEDVPILGSILVYVLIAYPKAPNTASRTHAYTLCL